MNIDSVHAWHRYLHILAGVVGLICFWVAVTTKKGGRVHVRAGWIFAALAFFFGLGGFFVSFVAVTRPDVYLGQSGSFMSTEERDRSFRVIRYFFGILGFLSATVVASNLTGVAVIRSRKQSKLWRRGIGLSVVIRFLATLFVIVAAISELADSDGWSLESLVPYSPHLALGLMSLLQAHDDWSYLTREYSKMEWWYRHMQNMLGLGIAFHTAFLVFGFSRLMERFGIRPFDGWWQAIPWIAPSALGLPAIHFWVRRYKAKFGDLPSRPPAATAAQVAR